MDDEARGAGHDQYQPELNADRGSLQPRQHDHHVALPPAQGPYPGALLPVAFVGLFIITGATVVYLFYVWWQKNYLDWRERWKTKRTGFSDTLLGRNMAQGSREGHASFANRVDGNENPVPKIVETTGGESRLGEVKIAGIKFMDEKSNNINLRPIITTRNYGGSSPKFVEDANAEQDSEGADENKDKEKMAASSKFVFPSTSADTSGQPGCSQSLTSLVKNKHYVESKCGRFKIPIHDKQWLTHTKDYKSYTVNIPKPYPLAQAVKTELGEELKASNPESRRKKFSATRSPSLEKDDKSPFVSSAKSDRNDVFAFGEEDVEKVAETNLMTEQNEGNDSSVVEVRVQPLSQNVAVTNINFNSNVTPISPKELSNRYSLKKSYSLSNDNANTPKEDFKNCNVLRHNQSNINLNICSVRDDNFWADSQQQERLEMQNSPHILECGSSKDKAGVTKFNFSPKTLAENQNSPKFFSHCQSSQNSPKFFAEASPKSPLVDNTSVHSTSNLRDNSYCSDTSKVMSPRNFSYDVKSACSPLEKQMSPKILLSGNTTPKSPKVSSYNKENCFRFDKSNSLEVKTRELMRQTSIDEVDNVSTARNTRMTYRAYAGRKSIERDNCSTSKEKFDARQYRRYNSCDSTNRNLEITNLNRQNDIESSMRANDNNNSTQSLNVLPNDNEDNRYMEKSIDKYEPLMNIEEVNMENVSKLDVESSNLSPEVGSANYRRQRLKSISLDSDNAKIIEQNLGLPIAKHMKQEHLSELYRDQDTSSSCYDVQRNNISVTVSPTSPSIHITNYNRFNFEYDNVKANSEKEEAEDKVEQVDDSRFSPQLAMTKKTLRDSSDTKSFIEMPRFSPKEFEVIITVEGKLPENLEPEPTPKMKRNRPNLTIDLTKRDSELEQELLEFELLYSDAEEKKVKTPTLKVKATSLDSSESINFSLPPKKTLDVPQNSISVPNTPKRQFKRILGQKNLGKGLDLHSGGKFGCNSLQNAEQRRLYCKGQGHLNDSGIFLRDNHANLMLYKPNVCITKYGGNNRRMGSFDENMTDFGENTPEISISNDCDARLTLPMQQLDISQSNLGSNLLNFKQNLSISSTNLKTLPEGVPSNDFEPSADGKFTKKCMLHRRGSNQSLMLSLDNPTTGKYSNFSSQSSNCSLNSAGASCHNLASIRNSSSNFSLNTDNRQKKLILERRNSNASLTLNIDHLTPNNRLSSNMNLQSSNCNLSTTELPQSCQPVKNCLLQRRGSNNSLSLNIQNSNTNLNRFSSNSSLNIHKDGKGGHRKGLLERRSSNTSLTLNINNSNPQLTTNRGLSISNYNLNGSTCNLSRYNSHQSINHPKEKGILARRSSNTSLTLNIQSQEVPRDLEIDEHIIDGDLKDGASAHCMFMMQRERHRKSLSTENLMPKSYKNNRIHKLKNSENPCTFGSHDNLWSNSYVADSDENFNECYGQNLMYLCGDPENEMIYACRDRQTYDEVPFSNSGFVRNITTKPLSPQTTSEDFKMYIANIQHLQSASNVLSRKQLKDLNDVFQNGYSKNKCSESQEGAACCKPKIDEQNKRDADDSDSLKPCAEYQKSLLRNLHQEFWDLPTNFQEKPMVFGSHVKNRYKTILPNEHSRFILRPEEGQSGEGYINANYIKGHEFTKNSYIATQGPLPNTVYDFWLMVQQNTERYAAGTVQKIVMLTNFNENNRQKCEKYFPIEVNEEIRFENGENEAGSCSMRLPKSDSAVAENKSNMFVIKNVGVVNKTGYTIRKLIVKYNKCRATVVKGDQGQVERTNMVASVINDDEQCAKDCNTKNNVEKYIVTENIPKKVDAEYFSVYHYWFHNWADHKCPKDVHALLNLSLDVLKDCKYDFSDKVTSIGEVIESSTSKAGEETLGRDVESKVKEDECECNVKTAEIKFIFPPLEAEQPKSVSQEAKVEETKPKAEVIDQSVCVSAYSLRSPEIENPPTIIHCSAGIGRTGCLIAILNGIKQLNYDQKVDILGIVCNMRLNRGGMVQNSEQYELIHKVLCLYEAIALPPL